MSEMIAYFDYRPEYRRLRTAEADMAEMVPGGVRTGPRTVEYEHEDPQMAFKGLRTMISLGGIAASQWAKGLYTTGAQVG